MVTRGEVGGGTATTGEDEHGIIYRIVGSLYCTPETTITLYVNHAGIKKKLI